MEKQKDLLVILSLSWVRNLSIHFVDDSPMVEFLMSSQEKIISRVEALRFLTDSSKRGILVCNIAASRLILPSPNVFKDSIVKIQVGEEI